MSFPRLEPYEEDERGLGGWPILELPPKEDAY